MMRGEQEAILTAAAHALRSYQHGNASPELAKAIADTIDAHLGKRDDRVLTKEQEEFFDAARSYFKFRGDRSAGTTFLDSADKAWRRMVHAEGVQARLQSRADEMARKREAQGAA